LDYIPVWSVIRESSAKLRLDFDGSREFKTSRFKTVSLTSASGA